MHACMTRDLLTVQGSGRAAYSDVPFKMKSIYGAVLMIGDPNLDRKFALRMHSGKLLQFKADSAKARSEWLVALRSCLGISASDVVQMETTMTPPVRRRCVLCWVGFFSFYLYTLDPL